MSSTGGGLRREGKLPQSKKHPGPLSQPTLPFTEGKKKTTRGRGTQPNGQGPSLFIHPFIHSLDEY